MSELCDVELTLILDLDFTHAGAAGSSARAAFEKSLTLDLR